MSSVFETLESRTLLSASPTFAPAASALLGAAKSARADLHQAGLTLQADIKSVAASLRGLPKTSQNQALLAKTRKDQQAWQTTLTADVNKLVQVGTNNAHKTVSDAIAVFMNPADAAAIARLTSDLTTVQNDVSGPLGKLESDAAAGRSALVTDVNSLASANPNDAALQSNAQQLQTDSQNALNTATADAQGLQGDLSTLIQNLANG